MPIQDFKCTACGLEHRDVPFRVSEFDELQCELCESPLEVWFRVAPGIVGMNPIAVRQVGKVFSNAKELDAWAENQGCEVISKNDHTWSQIRQQAIDDANEQAVEEGYKSWEDWNNKQKDQDHVREFVAENRERLAKEQGHSIEDHDNFSPTSGPLPEGKLKVATS